MERIPELKKFLPYTCEFDRCCYGTVDEKKNLLQKPWRVLTNMDKLKEWLSKKCPNRAGWQSHIHGEQRGQVAKKMEEYTNARVLASLAGLVSLVKQEGKM